MKIIVTGNQLEVTEAMQKYLEKKVGALEKFFDKIVEARFTLGMETHHHNKGEIFFAEAKVIVPGKDLFAKKTAKDIYAAIDIMKDELEAEVKKYKQQIRGNIKKNQAATRELKGYQDSEE